MADIKNLPSGIRPLKPYRPAEHEYQAGDAFKTFEDIVKSKHNSPQKTFLQNISEEIRSFYQCYEVKIQKGDYPSDSNPQDDECTCVNSPDGNCIRKKHLQRCYYNPQSTIAGCTMRGQTYNCADENNKGNILTQSKGNEPPKCIRKEALISCYEGNSKAMKSLRNRIFTLNPVPRCPYCDGLDTAATLDHFLPKGKYPQYAVFALNLIPCCWPCNKIKLEQEGGLNFYYDTDAIEKWTRIPCLSAKINFTEFYGEDKMHIPVMEFNFLPPSKALLKAFGKGTCGKIRSHYNQLGLLEKFSKKAITHVANFIVKVQRGTANKDALHDSIVDQADIEGVNHWEVVLNQCLYDQFEEIKKIYAKDMKQFFPPNV